MVKKADDDDRDNSKIKLAYLFPLRHFYSYIIAFYAYSSPHNMVYVKWKGHFPFVCFL